MKIYFMNNGPFDVRAMLTFGVSAKDNDNSIGYFGTGFKYAIAIILCIGGSVKINTCGKEFVFEKRTESIRGKSFDIVYMNDREAGLTTRVGVNWQPWMAFRELYCNAMDEDGEVSDTPKDYDTVVEVDCSEIYRAYQNKDIYILSGQPIHTTAQCDIYQGGSGYIYYRGIAVEHQGEKGEYTYNIKRNIELTEDRTARYSFQLLDPIKKTIQGLNQPAMLKTMIKSGDHFESKLNYEEGYGASDEFMQVCQELMKTDVGICESARRLIKGLDEKSGNWPEWYLTEVQLKALNKAIYFLEGIGITPKDYPIKTVQGLGDGVMGRALDGVIYLSEIPFQHGTKQIASTLIEEWVHIRTGASDFDRKMQNWLFDKILSIGEEINGEPI